MGYKFALSPGITVDIEPQYDLKKLYIELSSECNLKCPMCFRNAFKSEFGTMEYSTFEKLLSDLDDFPQLEHVLFGGIGEPLVNPNFFKMAKKIKERDLLLSVSTNGTLLIRQTLEKIIDLRIDELIISAETGDYGHPSVRFVKKLLQRIEAMKEKKGTGKPAISIETILTTQNYKDFPATLSELIPHGVRRVIVSNILPVFETHTHLPLYVHPPEGIDLRKFISEYIVDRVKSELPHFELKTERHCNFVEKKATVVRWDGEVAPCYRFLHSSTEYVYGLPKEIHAHSFGNIMESSLGEIWTSREYTWFRFKVKNNLFPSCTDCDFRDGCFFVQDTENDCWGNSPSCADCLWWRNIIVCP